jgi:hypothetical protein
VIRISYHSRCIATTEPHKVASHGRAELDPGVTPPSQTRTLPCRSSRLYRLIRDN